MPITYRYIHRTLSACIVVPLASTALTGFIYKYALVSLEIPKDKLSWLMKLHQFNYFSYSSVIYTTLLFTAVLALSITGWTMMSPYLRTPSSLRHLHNFTATIIFIFLGITAATGWMYRYSRNVLEMEKKDVRWMLDMHMLFLEDQWSVIYTFTLCGAVLILAVSGLVMIVRRRSRTG